MLPKISVITPSLNQSKYIERTILSIINQNYPNLELIVVDGGSTDGSEKIFNKYEKYMHRCIREPDKGQSQAINKGLRIASGDLIAFQNSDDVYLEGAFHKIAGAFCSHKNCGVFTGNILIIDRDDRVINCMKLIKPRLSAQVFNGSQLHNQATFWTRETMRSIGYMNEQLHFCMDYEYFLRFLRNKIRFYHLNENIGAFRIHPESKTINKHEIHLNELNKIRKEYRSCLGLSKYLPNFAPVMINKIYKSLIHISRGDIAYLFRRRNNIIF